jgi:hypothetical protein
VDREERPASLVPPVLEGPRAQQERPGSLAPPVVEGQVVSVGLRGPQDRQDPPDRVTSRRSLRSRNKLRDWPENSRRT